MHNHPLLCMNSQMRELIGDLIGKVLDENVQEDGVGWEIATNED